eukprot:scaffold20397_cov62-Phaeocystis_antarctica.AAC.2
MRVASGSSAPESRRHGRHARVQDASRGARGQLPAEHMKPSHSKLLIGSVWRLRKLFSSRLWIRGEQEGEK